MLQATQNLGDWLESIDVNRQSVQFTLSADEHDLGRIIASLAREMPSDELVETLSDEEFSLGGICIRMAQKPVYVPEPELSGPSAMYSGSTPSSRQVMSSVSSASAPARSMRK